MDYDEKDEYQEDRDDDYQDDLKDDDYQDEEDRDDKIAGGYEGEARGEFENSRTTKGPVLGTRIEGSKSKSDEDRYRDNLIKLFGTEGSEVHELDKLFESSIPMLLYKNPIALLCALRVKKLNKDNIDDAAIYGNGLADKTKQLRVSKFDIVRYVLMLNETRKVL